MGRAHRDESIGVVTPRYFGVILFPGNARQYPTLVKPQVDEMKAGSDPIKSKLVVVIDDDPLVLEATGGLLRSWGCQVVTAESHDAALRLLAKCGQRPDMIVCDYRLADGPTGVDAITSLRNAFAIPALLISADGGSPPGDNAVESYNLLHKPVDAQRFRAALIDAAVLRV